MHYQCIVLPLYYKSKCAKLVHLTGIKPVCVWLQIQLAMSIQRKNVMVTIPLLLNHVADFVWRSQGVTIPFFSSDSAVCVHEHFETLFFIIIKLTSIVHVAF